MSSIGEDFPLASFWAVFTILSKAVGPDGIAPSLLELLRCVSTASGLFPRLLPTQTGGDLNPRQLALRASRFPLAGVKFFTNISCLIFFSAAFRCWSRAWTLAPRIGVPSSIAPLAPRIGVPSSIALAPRICVPSSVAIAPRIGVPSSIRSHGRRDKMVSLLNFKSHSSHFAMLTSLFQK
jgi:hypothetical protein